MMSLIDSFHLENYCYDLFLEKKKSMQTLNDSGRNGERNGGGIEWGPRGQRKVELLESEQHYLILA